MKDALGHGSDAHGGGIQSRVGRVKGWAGSAMSEAKRFMGDKNSGGKMMSPSVSVQHHVMELLHEPAVVDYGDTFNNIAGIFHKLIG